MSSKRVDGKVKWFNAERGYGFIVEDGDKDEVEYFVHYSYIDMEGYKSLKVNQKVSFVLVQTEKGPQAQDVRLEE
jgi:cold shock protein